MYFLVLVLFSWPCVFPSAVLYWVYTNLYCFIYWVTDQNVESTLTILPYQEGPTEVITFGSWECLYYDSGSDIQGNIGWALGKSFGLRPWNFPRAHFTVYLSSRHNTDTLSDGLPSLLIKNNYKLVGLGWGWVNNAMKKMLLAPFLTPAETQISVLLSASVKRFGVSRIRDF